MASFLPPVINAQTIPTLIGGLDRAFYPTPTPGFTARMAVLWALSGLSILLALVYLWLHWQCSTERPRRRCMWLVRLVERSNGRLIALNIRPTWSCVVLLYSCFNNVFLGFFYGVYELKASQRAFIGLREFNAVVLFIGGWVMTWANMQAFLLAVETRQPFLTSRRANGLFLGVGLALVVILGAMDTATTVLGIRLYDSYVELRTVLVNLEQSLDGRSPTLLDFLPLRATAEALGAANDAQKTPSIVQLSLITLFPLSISVVNVGGIALAMRLRRQIKENYGALAQGRPVMAGEKNADAVVVQLPFAPARCNSSSLGGTAAEATLHQSVSTLIKQDSPRAPSSVEEARHLAFQPRQGGGSAAARTQARTTFAMTKAAHDMQAITITIVAMCVCLTAMAIWGACCVATDKVSSGEWAYTEGTILPPQWIYTVALFVASVVVTVNALRSRRGIANLETIPAARSLNGYSPQTHPSDAHWSTSCGQGSAVKPAAPTQDRQVQLDSTQARETGQPSAAPDADGDTPTQPSLTPGTASRARLTALRTKSWTSLRSVSGRSRTSSAGGRHGAGPSRSPSLASAVRFTVETTMVESEVSDGGEPPAIDVGDGRQ